MARPVDLFINDNLTKNRSKFLYVLRQAKRRRPDIIAGCGSHDGRVFAWIKSPDPATKNQKIIINSWLKLSTFCEKSLQIDANSLIENGTTLS